MSNFVMRLKWLVFPVLMFLCLSASATEPMPDKLALQDALLAGRFDYLELTLGVLQVRYKSGAIDDRVVDHAFDAFGSTNPAFDAQLTAWVRTYPRSGFAHLARAIHLSHLGWTSRGTRFVQKTSEGQLQRMSDYFRAAREELREAITIDPELSVAYAEAIRLEKADGVSTPSVSLALALKRCPDSFMVRYAHVFGLQPKWGGSINEMRRFIDAHVVDGRKNPALAPLRGFPEFTLGNQLAMDKKYTESLPHYSKALASGGMAVYYEGRAKAYNKLERYGEALVDLNSAISLSPQDPGLLEDRADTYIDMGNLDLAMLDLDLAMRLDPLNPRLLWSHARVLKKLGKNREAIAAYERSLIFDPDNAWVYARMGSTAMDDIKDYRTASAHFQKAAELEPEEADYWYDFATAMYHRKECEARYPLAKFLKVCSMSTDRACTEERVRWAEGLRKFVAANRACASVTDDTRPVD